MKTVKPKKVRSVSAKKISKPQPVKPKLSKSDPDYYAKIGAISAAKRKLDSDYFSEMAKKSHGENSRRDGYHGGRRKKNGN